MQKTVKKYNANSSCHKHELSPDRSSVRPTDHPSNRESVRPTVRPVLLRRKTNIVLSATTSTVFIATTKVAAVGRHHKRGGGRATSFVVSFVEAVNIVNIVAVNTVLVLHLSQPGGLLAGRAVGRIYGSVP